MQTQTAVPTSTENPTGTKIFYGIFGALLVVLYLVTFWIFLNGVGLIVGGGRANATVTQVEDATRSGTASAVTSTPATPATVNNYNIQTKDLANRYTFNFKTETGQVVEKAYVTTAYDLGQPGSQVKVIYNRNDPDQFIMDGFLPIFYYVGKNCLLFVTLTVLIIIALVRMKIKKARLATR
ncbi:MAG: hypothetical protein JWP00_493 [Chloroflexi bacterium]|jgi:hypothetical protein|nr:hypothetical protein [Chloroflexota bacterium]